MTFFHHFHDPLMEIGLYIDLERKITCSRLLDLENEPYPSVAPWPTNIADMERLSTHASARCLRVRIAAIQDALTQFNNTAIVRWLCMCLDHHAPLMLALEGGPVDVDIADETAFDPLEQTPLLPTLPGECQKMLPMLWALKSATTLKKWPLLKLLWKAAPRKCHSKDVEAMVRDISKSSKRMATSIQAIHKASLLGNYA